jgi:hypothetical protein
MFGKGWTAVHPSVHFLLSRSLDVRQKQAISGKTHAAEHTPWTKIEVSLNSLFSEHFRNEKVGGAGRDRTDE